MYRCVCVCTYIYIYIYKNVLCLYIGLTGPCVPHSLPARAAALIVIIIIIIIFIIIIQHIS